MRTAAQLSAILSTYFPIANGQSAATTILPALNLILPVLYPAGDWKCLTVPDVSFDASSGIVGLPPHLECILAARLNDYRVDVRATGYEYHMHGPGLLSPPVSHIYGIVDKGYQPLMRDPPDDGIEELIFSCESSAFASGDTATVTYDDEEEGYAQVVLPLHTTTVASSTSPAAISVAADGGTDAATGEVLTTLTTANNSAMGLVAGLGLTLSQLTGTDATYINTFRIHSIPSSTSVKIVKAYVALTGTLAAVTTPRLMPVSNIEAVRSIVYAGLPGRTLVKDLDDNLYADLMPGDGAAEFRRYSIPQIPDDNTETWTLKAVCKRKFIPLTATSDLVYLDDIPVLKQSLLAINAEDNGDLKRAEVHWNEAKRLLSSQVFDARGGAEGIPAVEIWGAGIAAIAGYS